MVRLMIKGWLSGAVFSLGVLSVFGLYFYTQAATILPGAVTNPTFGPNIDNVVPPSQFVGYGASVTVKANAAPQGMSVWYSALGQCGNGNSTSNSCFVNAAVYINGVKLPFTPQLTTELSVGEGETNLVSTQLTGVVVLLPGTHYNASIDNVITFPQSAGNAGGAGGSYFSIVANTNKVMVLAQ